MKQDVAKAADVRDYRRKDAESGNDKSGERAKFGDARYDDALCTPP